MAIPSIIWTDHKRRLVLLAGDTPEQNDYRLEVREGDSDAMGHPHWRPTELTWELFKDILRSVVSWMPVVLNPDEMQ